MRLLRNVQFFSLYGINCKIGVGFFNGNIECAHFDEKLEGAGTTIFRVNECTAYEQSRNA